MSVRGFLGKDYRDAEPAVLYGIFLEFIIGLRCQTRVESRLQSLLCPRVCAESGP